MKIKDTNFDKLFAYSTEHKIYCTNPKCSGHGIVFYNSKVDRVPCINCGNYIYRDDKTRLKYEMKERGVNVE